MLIRSDVFNEINKDKNKLNIILDELVAALINKQKIVKLKPYPKAPISEEDFQFAKKIMADHFLANLRSDNFCIDLVNVMMTLKSTPTFDELDTSKLDEKPYLIKDQQDKYKIWGYKENKWQLTDIDNIKISFEWKSNQAVIISPTNEIYDALKKGHTTNIQDWTKEQYRAFAKLMVLFTDKAAQYLLQRQDNKVDVTKDIQLIYLKLPKQNNKIVNGICKKMLNPSGGYEVNTGNEEGVTLFKYINKKKQNPIVPFKHVNTSISLVVVTDNDKVLLLRRGGASGRAGFWGTLTGTIEKNEAKETALVREVNEEINILLKDKPVHFVGSMHTPNLSKDLFEKGELASYADDCSYVYGIYLPEDELRAKIKLDSENSAWRLFSREELHKQFNVHSQKIHGDKFDPKEMHVALAKSLLVLDASKSNFSIVEEGKFNYPQTNSHGFFARTNFYLLQMQNKSGEELNVSKTIGNTR